MDIVGIGNASTFADDSVTVSIASTEVTPINWLLITLVASGVAVGSYAIYKLTRKNK